MGGSINFILGGHTHGLTCTRTQGKGSDFIGAWVKSTSWSWRVSWGYIVWLWLTLTTWTLMVEISSSQLLELLWRQTSCFLQHQHVAVPKKPAGSCSWMPQAKQSTGWEHSPSNQPTQCLTHPEFLPFDTHPEAAPASSTGAAGSAPGCRL